MNFRFRTMTFLIVAGLVIPCAAQHEVTVQEGSQPQNQLDHYPQVSTYNWMLTSSTQDDELHARYLTVIPHLQMQPFPFVSKNGNYAAQNNVEVRTYEDLAMDFEFIEKSHVRRQLSLPKDEGVFVVEVSPSGEGHKNGFQEGDIILQVDGKPVDTQYDFVVELAEKRGNDHNVLIRRDGDVQHLTIKLTPSTETNERFVVGVSVEQINDLVKAQLKIDAGVAITGLTDDYPAQQAGLQLHDVVVEISGHPVNSLDDLRSAVQGSKGEPLTIDFIRQAKKLSVEVTPRKVESLSTTYEFQPHVQNAPLLQYYFPFQPHPHQVDFTTGQWHAEHGQESPSDQQNDEMSDIQKRLAELEAKIDRILESIKK